MGGTRWVWTAAPGWSRPCSRSPSASLRRCTWPPAPPARPRSGTAGRAEGCPPPRMRQAVVMRFATWNVNSIKARLPRLLEWLTDTKPDVVCLQETKVPADGFPAEVAELGYAVAAYGQGRWNGVALLSKVGLDDVRQGFPGEPGFPDVEARAIG